MKLYINPQGGIAGDMFSAALIDAGADATKVVGAMKAAAEVIGRASITHVKTADCCSRLHIRVEHHHGHLSSHKAIHLLEHLFEDFHIEPPYADFGFRTLRALIAAEKKAHDHHDFKMDTLHFHHHQKDHHHHGEADHPHIHESEDNHQHHHHHNETLYHEPEVWLHEAQDILIDIMGAVVGLQELGAPVNADLVAPVSYGGGSVSFSHGTLKVPAPATQAMIDEFGIPVKPGPIEIELFTPTGAALLTALGAFQTTLVPAGEPRYQGKSRGTKDLPSPSLELLIFE
jgi:pyridinium-3,5-bisthiocarboxylic acid mononucleotide nickel chelatase